jgi:NAD(P)-dependent dehydrogenase (short-subunit alcohol dehydrogenase family)
VVVLVTGCSTGIGLLTALTFAREGHRVFATVRSVAKADALRAAADDEGLAVEIVELDVTDDESVERCVAEVLARASTIDVLVNNAGILGRAAVETFPDEAVRDIFETNFFGVLRMLRAVLPTMREQGSGSIVNVSSRGGLCVVPYTCNSMYSASKHALEAMTEQLAFEVRPFGIGVTLVEPAFFRTTILDKLAAATYLSTDSPYYAEEKRAYDNSLTKAATGGGDPQEVADAIYRAATSESPPLRILLADPSVLLASDDGEWMDVQMRVALPKQ